MKIKLQNIGIVKDSTIDLNGLTVITGKNNSGKTTVGKAVYSLLDAVCNLQVKARSDRYIYIRKQLYKVTDCLDIFRTLKTIISDENNESFFSRYTALNTLFSKDFRWEIDRRNIEVFAKELMYELESFDISELKTNLECIAYYKYLMAKDKPINYIAIIEEQRFKALEILNKMFIAINQDFELISYTRECINQTLLVEFSQQIQPVKTSVEYSAIELSNDDSIYFKLNIIDNKIVDDNHPVFWGSPYNKVFFIDDPFILDDFSRKHRPNYISDTFEAESIVNPNRICPHKYKLQSAIKSVLPPTVLEQTVINESLKTIKAKIDKIIPGTFEFSSAGEYYVQDGSKLKISNLATGSKMFSIIKLLLEKGEIDDATMLILDEPEAHLHPMWQNAFAELIVLLVKDLNVNILLTTHSPNFMLALDAYMRKYKLADKSNFYQTNALEDGFVQYSCVNDDMGKIYQDFTQYLSEMKMLRQFWINTNPMGE